MRREESIKIKPGWVDGGNILRLQDSWTKGGKCREVPIGTMQQRAVLDAAKVLAGKGSLIPAKLRYRDQLNRFRAQCDKAGIHGVQGYYLAVVLHLFARRAVGWVFSPRPDADLVVPALEMAYKQRGRPQGLPFHSDHGSQYASRKFS